MRTSLSLLVLCLVIYTMAFAALSETASAVPTTYATRATFLTDTRITGSVATEDFEDAAAGPGVTTSNFPVGGLNNATGDGTIFQNGDIVPGVTFDDDAVSAGTPDMAVTANGFLFGGSTINFAPAPFTNGLDMTFSGAVTAVGMDMFFFNGGTNTGTITVTAFDANGVAIFGTAPVITTIAGGYTFIGIVTDTPISRVNLTGTGLAPFFGTGAEIIDNLVFNPEPSSWALMLLGLAGMGGFVRRRRRLRAAV